MCDLEEQEIIDRQVFLTGLPQFRDSRAPSSDCGFFCGMALKLLFDGNGNPEYREVSRREVYEARERYLETSPPLLTHRHDRTLEHHDVAAFLTRGLQWQHSYQNHDVRTLSDIWQQMPRYKGSDQRYGVMFGFLIGSSGHWAVVLQISGAASQLRFRIYDPSGIPGTPQRSMEWLSSEQAARRYPPIMYVISTSS
jgi:hypothetical protein